MKTILSLLFLILTVCGTAAAQANSSKSFNSDLSFIIKISNNWKLSKQKLLTLKLRNNSQSRVIVKEADGGTERNYTVELKNSNDEIIPLSSEGRRLTNRKSTISVIYARIAKDEEITRTLDLTKLYSLKDDEHYTILVTTYVYIEAEKKYRKIKSNTIKIM